MSSPTRSMGDLVRGRLLFEPRDGPSRKEVTATRLSSRYGELFAEFRSDLAHTQPKRPVAPVPVAEFDAAAGMDAL